MMKTLIAYLVIATAFVESAKLDEKISCFSAAFCQTGDKENKTFRQIYPLPKCTSGSSMVNRSKVYRTSLKFNISIATFFQDLDNFVAEKCPKCNARQTLMISGHSLADVEDCYAPVMCSVGSMTKVAQIQIRPLPLCNNSTRKDIMFMELEDSFNKSRNLAVKALEDFVFNDCNFCPSRKFEEIIDNLKKSYWKRPNETKRCYATVTCRGDQGVSDNVMRYPHPDCKSSTAFLRNEAPEQIFSSILQNTLQAIQQVIENHCGKPCLEQSTPTTPTFNSAEYTTSKSYETKEPNVETAKKDDELTTSSSSSTAFSPHIENTLTTDVANSETELTTSSSFARGFSPRKQNASATAAANFETKISSTTSERPSETTNLRKDDHITAFSIPSSTLLRSQSTLTSTATNLETGISSTGSESPLETTGSRDLEHSATGSSNANLRTTSQRIQPTLTSSFIETDSTVTTTPTATINAKDDKHTTTLSFPGTTTTTTSTTTTTATTQNSTATNFETKVSSVGRAIPLETSNPQDGERSSTGGVTSMETTNPQGEEDLTTATTTLKAKSLEGTSSLPDSIFQTNQNIMWSVNQEITIGELLERGFINKQLTLREVCDCGTRNG